MKTAKVLCRCGKQVCYFKEFFPGNIQDKIFQLLTEQGYYVIIGENLKESEPALYPCGERNDCTFAKYFSTKNGFISIFKWEK